MCSCVPSTHGQNACYTNWIENNRCRKIVLVVGGILMALGIVLFIYARFNNALWLPGSLAFSSGMITLSTGLCMFNLNGRTPVLRITTPTQSSSATERPQTQASMSSKPPRNQSKKIYTLSDLNRSNSSTFPQTQRSTKTTLYAEDYQSRLTFERAMPIISKYYQTAPIQNLTVPAEKLTANCMHQPTIKGVDSDGKFYYAYGLKLVIFVFKEHSPGGSFTRYILDSYSPTQTNLVGEDIVTANNINEMILHS